MPIQPTSMDSLLEQIRRHMSVAVREIMETELQEAIKRFDQDLKEAQKRFEGKLKDFVLKTSLDIQGLMNVRIMGPEIAITIRIPEKKEG